MKIQAQLLGSCLGDQAKSRKLLDAVLRDILQLESVVAASAPPLGADEQSLRQRWKEAAVQLVVAGVATR